MRASRFLLVVALIICGALARPAFAEGKGAHLEFAPASPQARYAADKLNDALRRAGYGLAEKSSAQTFRIVLTVPRRGLQAESFAITPGKNRLTIEGGDNRGLIYGALSVADQLDGGKSITSLRRVTEHPRLGFRAIKFDLPWESYRSSGALDQHMSTVRDVRFWTAFLDMMVRNRFNAITLSNLDPWPYMVRTKGFEKANPFDDQQLDEWRELHRAIFRLAKERGIDTYLLPFNIFVSKEFAASYKAGSLNTYPRFNTKGDMSPIIRRYIRSSAAQVLAEYPDLTGLGINLGEGMGDMSADERLEWVDDTYLAAIRDAKRPVKLMWSISSVETKEWKRTSDDPRVDERRLRAAVEAIDFVEGPVLVDLKFNWSHALSTTKLVQIHGGKVGSTYFQPYPRNYKVDWIARNEDVFALRWGVPSFVRGHVRANGTLPYVAGYTVGSETYIPALDYFTAAASHPQWTYAFERQWLFYMLWGRLLYDPATPYSVFVEAFARRYGAKGRPLLRAYELASATPLRLASLFYSQWDHTLYSEGMLWLDGRSMRYIGVEALMAQRVLDPAYVSVADYVAAQQSGRHYARSRITPPRLAALLEIDCRKALALVDAINPGTDQALANEIADVRTWAHLGLHLAAKIRGAVALRIFQLNGDPLQKTTAIRELRTALAEWDRVVTITTPLYKPMYLTHFTGQSSALNPDAEFHWSMLRSAVASDVQLALTAEPKLKATDR